ncbi:hypothetical protein M408DRAFT_212475 [Serendipita vermifera MAFF 305830]|uniref:Uncharacterized protein n=1 Tax=Serendipita vermifera MAFF 305830 TaxID=933852 RepID=A0A0C3B1A0_SERVB|nr:hypothetical protein M408DRAFT_212475 [Serendipita vermifera MAFF 305830]
MPRFLLPPTVEQHFQFVQDGVDSLNFWIPTCRTLWDGRTGVFSRSMRMAPPPENFVADYVTVSVVNLARDSKGAFKEKYHHGTVKRHIAHWFNPSNSELLAAPAEWDVCAMGTFAKTTVWMERMHPKEEEKTDSRGRMKICFAEFPPAEDDEASPETPRDGDPPSDNPIPDPAGEDSTSSNIEAIYNSIELEWGDGLLDSYETPPPPDTQESDEAPVDSTAPETQPDNGSNDLPPILSPELLSPSAIGLEAGEPVPSAIEAMLMEEVPPPVCFGHVCEYEMEESWERRYGGVYTVDFDDVRGIAAFATGSGKIVLLEFV